MPSTDIRHLERDLPDGQSAIGCDACQSVVADDGQQRVSFLLLDNLTIPVLSCDDHLAAFAETCGLTTSDSADLLDHRPAGGVPCPGCRNARYNVSQPVIPVEEGMLAVLACPEHQAAITQRFHSGLETRQQLTSTLDSTTDVSL